MFPFSWLQSAAKNIHPYIQQTPLTYDADLDLFLKWENQQITGSFKARGAFNKVLNLHEWERQRGLVTASAGNHGLGLALVGKTFNSPVTIFTSEHAAKNKLDAMQALGVTLITVKGGYAEAEISGLSYAEENEATWVSPYNDGQVIAGQGTIGLEILQQAPEMSDSTWLVPVGGGGLISGVALAVKDNPDLRKNTTPYIIGVQSEASPFMHSIFYQNTQKGVVEYPSLADGLEGAVEDRSVTIHLVRKFVDEIILVGEEEIAKAIKFAWQKYHQKIEGSAAVTLAAVISGKITQRPVLAIITGGNIDLNLHQELICDKV